MSHGIHVRKLFFSPFPRIIKFSHVSLCTSCIRPTAFPSGSGGSPWFCLRSWLWLLFFVVGYVVRRVYRPRLFCRKYLEIGQPIFVGYTSLQILPVGRFEGGHLPAVADEAVKARYRRECAGQDDRCELNKPILCEPQSDSAMQV